MWHLLLEMADDPDDHAFDLEGIGVPHHDRLHQVVGGMEFDGSRLVVVDLDRGVPVHEGNDRLTIPCGGLLLHDDHISWENPIVSHRGPLHAQREGIPTTQHALGDFDSFRLWDRLDGFAGCDHTSHLNVSCSQVLQGDFSHPRDAAAAIFIPNHRPASRAQLLGELTLSEMKELSGLTKLCRSHR